VISDHLKKLRLRSTISNEEEQAIRGLVSQTRQVRADSLLVRAGQELNSSILLVDGWLFRSKDLQSGVRQVLEIHVSGDFADLHGFTLKRLDHDIVTVTECTIAEVPHARLIDLFERHPDLVRIYWLMTNIDASISREMILSLGQRSAVSRMAHLFCELHARLEVVGRTRGNMFDFPLTQRELADCLGLTVVHVNRTLQELRRNGLIESQNRQLVIVDKPRLEALAEFDPAYLHLEQRTL
jgi:CRP-like cAMP-binding protein